MVETKPTLQAALSKELKHEMNGLIFLLRLRGRKLRDEPAAQKTQLGPPPATPNVSMPASTRYHVESRSAMVRA